MRDNDVLRRLPFAFGAVALFFASLLGVIRAQVTVRGDEFNDSHFHLTNYIQQGIEPRQFLRIMGSRVSRSTLFGIPLQQHWSYANSGEFAPT